MKITVVQALYLTGCGSDSSGDKAALENNTAEVVDAENANNGLNQIVTSLGLEGGKVIAQNNNDTADNVLINDSPIENIADSNSIYTELSGLSVEAVNNVCIGYQMFISDNISSIKPVQTSIKITPDATVTFTASASSNFGDYYFDTFGSSYDDFYALSEEQQLTYDFTTNLYTYNEAAEFSTYYDCVNTAEILVEETFDITDSGQDIDGKSLWIPSYYSCGYFGTVFGGVISTYGSMAFTDTTQCGILIPDGDLTQISIYNYPEL